MPTTITKSSIVHAAKQIVCCLVIGWSVLLSAKAAAGSYDIVVAKDGSGDYTTVQDAINAVAEDSETRTTIFVKSGVYKEKLIVRKKNLTLLGEDWESTILTYDDYTAKIDATGNELSPADTASIYIYSGGFSAKNITFSNTSGPVGQAIAVWVQGNEARFFNCRILGNQDTLYTARKKQYFKNCYIEGTVDFIFGGSTAVFDRCTIGCKDSGVITAACTPSTKKYGYVFRHCTITGSAPDGSVFLGRPWRPYSKVTFVKCDLGKLINPLGWDNWENPDLEKTVRYGEYKNVGEGAQLENRVPWSHELTDAEDSENSLKKIFRLEDEATDSTKLWYEEDE